VMKLKPAPIEYWVDTAAMAAALPLRCQCEGCERQLRRLPDPQAVDPSEIHKETDKGNGAGGRRNLSKQRPRAARQDV
jgi:hypothetical protein